MLPCSQPKFDSDARLSACNLSRLSKYICCHTSLGLCVSLSCRGTSSRQGLHPPCWQPCFLHPLCVGHGLPYTGSSSTVRCCSVGRELIKGNWKEAVRLLMSGHEGERADSAQARRLFLEDEDIAGALKQMPRHQTVERAILEVEISFCRLLHTDMCIQCAMVQCTCMGYMP